MLDPVAPAPSPARLRSLLERSASGLADDVVAEARALGAEPAGELVASLVQAELSRPTANGTAVRAAHLAHELRLVQAIPALIRCLERLSPRHPLQRAALGVVAGLGSASIDGLLQAFHRCETTEARARIAEVLSRAGVKDDRIRAAFVRMLEDDPVNGARHLAEHGDWRAVHDLSRAADRLLLAPVGDCVICDGEHLTAIAAAVRVLGGRLSDGQLTGIDEVLERGEAHWIPFADPLIPPRVLPAPATLGSRPGRNDPCHCGSGKKYKRCHLDSDERDARH